MNGDAPKLSVTGPDNIILICQANCNPKNPIAKLKNEYRLIPVCPETAGGLPVPRDPSERLGDKVVSSKGKDVTAEFVKGAETALYLAKRYGCRKALLKRNSPSCGGEFIYDGSFSGVLVPGEGVAAEMLKAAGIEVFGE